METTNWKLEPMHSEVGFSLRHMMISSVTGFFKKFDASVEMEGTDFTTAKVHFKADVDSIDTNNAQRDGHLKAPDFFDAAQFPQITFEGVKLEKVRDEKYRLAGELTIRGVTKPIILDVEYGGTIKDPWGNTRSGFTLEGKLNRKDFGLSWSQLTETGGMVAGFEVKLHANVEFIKEQSAATENDIAKAA